MLWPFGGKKLIMLVIYIKVKFHPLLINFLLVMVMVMQAGGHLKEIWEALDCGYYPHEDPRATFKWFI